MLPFSDITTLHANIDDLEGVREIFPSFLTHFHQLRELSFLLSRGWIKSGTETQLIESFFGALLPTSTADVVCPELELLGLEAELAHEDFPFSTLESMAAAQTRAGHRPPRFVYHPHMRAYDTEDVRQRLSASSSPLTASIGAVEYRRAGEAKVCPFRPPECWARARPDAEKYWPLPHRLWYGVDQDVENS